MTSITEAMICWSPRDGLVRDRSTIGKVALFHLLDRRGDVYECAIGACNTKVRTFSRQQREYFVLSTAWRLVLDYHLDPAEVHRALWPLDEYRAALPADCPAPAAQMEALQ